MKQLVCLACLLVLLLSACAVKEQIPTIPEGNYSYGIYELTFKEKMLSNDFVGNDWSFTYTHNGQVIKSGYKITQSLEIFAFQSIDVVIRENDNIDDVGTGTLTVAICEVGSGKTQISVTETNGRYKGNTAVWEIACEVKLADIQ